TKIDYFVNQLGFKMAQIISTQIDKLIGKRIQLKRKEKGWSAEKMAELLDVSQQQLSRYERGVNKINVAHLVEIANLLQTPIDYFFEDCIKKVDYQENSYDVAWQKLTNEQKRAVLTLIQTLTK
ncbi:helix-turn-helix transcriptional regulator, partial [Moraxella sp.]|uniref:helix-turn-helix domain-containing protein n=1 Tax=Moraxella sp. TaxID=479 RepID=UPI00261B9570